MRILMLAPWFNVHSTRPLNWLLEEGHEVIFMDARDPYPEGRERYHFIPYPYAEEEVTVAVLREIGEKLAPDIVHVHWVDQRAWHCVRAGLKPLVLSVWGSDVNDQFLPAATPRYREMIGAAIGGADLTVVDAPTMDEKCAALAGREVPTALIHLGLDTHRFSPGYRQEALAWRKRLQIPAEARVFLSQRAWGPSYGHHTLLEGFAAALPRLPEESYLLFKIYNRISYADHKAYEMELRRRAIELGVSGKVRWVEEVSPEALPHIYALSDVVLNYPVKDTIPITFMEAAACGKPVVSVRLPIYAGSFAERFFTLVPPDDPGALADGMVAAIRDAAPDREERLAEARRVVVERYDESVYRRELAASYRALAGRG